MHTPGPWKYSTNVGPTKALIVENDGSTVLEIGNRTHDSRFLPNTRLIAAAPDLLEALRNLAYHEARISPPPYGHSCRWCGDCVQRAKDDARNAIKKAEGR